MFRNLTAVAFASSLFVSTAAAQTLEVEMDLMQSTAGFTTKVDFTVTGYPGSMATLFVSPGKTLAKPAPIPGLGNLYLNPSSGIFDIGRVRIDKTSGIGKLSFTIPTASLSGLMLVSQALVETKPGTMQLTSWSGLNVEAPALDYSFYVAAVSHDYRKGRSEVEVQAPMNTFVGIWRKTCAPGHKTKLTLIDFRYVPRSEVLRRKFDITYGPHDSLLVIIGKGTSAYHFETDF